MSFYNLGMKAIVISSQGTPVAPNVNIVHDWPDPDPAPGEVVVKTEAMALNHLDLWVGRGLPGFDFTYPRISGSDGAGTVSAVGAGVDESWIGTRVALNARKPAHDPVRPDFDPAPPDTFMIGEHIHGTMGEFFVAPAENLVSIGDVAATDAAAFSLSHLTAWRMMTSRAQVRPGQWVLITGIGGGVALAALGIAKHLGCKVIVTSRHQWKLDKAKELGADHGVLDEGEDWSRTVRGLTGKRGVDVCIDSIGKVVHVSCIKSLARGGAFVTCGCTTGPNPPTDLARIFWNQLSILGSTMGDMDEFRAIMALLRSGAIRPVIDSVYDFADAREAYARIESGDHFGKIVIRAE